MVPASVSPNKSESAAIDKVWIYGHILLDDNTEITCYEVLLQPKVPIEQSKVAIQQYVRKLLTAGQAALINFVAPSNKNIWRLTLVAKDSILTEKGVKEKTTNAKRYTFLLGPSETCKTAAERFEFLSIEKEITFQTLINAFSVEKLSKAFFDEYTLHYHNFCDYLQESNYRKSVFNITFPANASKQEKDKASKPIRDFVKKLLGRIVFLYFVQKKGWLGASDTNYTDGLGDFIKQLFNKSGGNDTFYSNWLTVLFFDTLNKERPNDDFIMPDGKVVKVPFLNGGLFDKEEFDEHLLTFKSKLFHHPDFEEDILTAKSKGNARGFLDFLDAFNFTVYEDSPDDHTVAVDPEMLGHIFENLLEDNKDKGAFYTPKEIVHYMCQESLTEYLCTALQIKDKDAEREAINRLLKDKVVDDILKPKIGELEKALDNVKICDPAIGSGAFPMGLLQEIYSIKELIAYETGKEWKPAEAKLNIIQKSIYGVDIEKGAVDIARLRFWLSLVVDEEKPKALPNLDYKIVVGDSLISKFDGEIVEIDWEIKAATQTEMFGNENLQNRKQLLQNLTDKQRKYFDPENKNKKALALEIRNHKIDVLVNQLELMVKADGLEQAPVKTNFKVNKKFLAAQELYQKTEGWLRTIRKLKNLKQYPDEPFNHFDWKLDFPEVLNPYMVNGNGGFDIVIGNPPYIQLQKMGKETDKLQEAGFETFARTGDIYCLFYEKGIDLLKKQSGVLSYITSNSWMKTKYGEPLRKFFVEKSNPIKLLNFEDTQIFPSATVEVNILIAKKQKYTKETESVALKQDVANQTIQTYFDNNKVILNDLSEEEWVLLSKPDFIIKLEIEKKPTLKSLDYKIISGVKTGLNEAYLIGKELRDELILRDPKNIDIIRPIIRGRDISKYNYSFNEIYCVFTHNGNASMKISAIDSKNDYPTIFEYLLSFEEKIINRPSQGRHWTNVPTNYLKEFNSEKLIWGELSDKPKFAYDNSSSLTEATVFNLTGNHIKFILTILNSRLCQWYFETFTTTSGMGTNRWKKYKMEKIPIAHPKEEVKNIFENVAEYLIYLNDPTQDSVLEKTSNENISQVFEDLANMMVYELYFEEEMKAKEIDVLQFVTEKAFPDITKVEDPKATIQKVYYELQQKDNPIRNRILVASSRSETIARINAATS